MSKHYLAFNQVFFNKHQSKLLWLINSRLTRRWFRWVLRINGRRSDVGGSRITKILPNAIFWESKAEFRTHSKYGKRLYFAFKPLWWFLHFWDWFVADRFIPKYSFGFATLTAYPDPHPETTTVDGTTQRDSADEVWATIRSGAGMTAIDSSSELQFIRMISSATSNQWQHLSRAFFLFDTSSLTTDAVISAAVLSLRGTDKSDVQSRAPDIDIYTSTPASNTALVASDYANVGTTSQTGAPISYASWSASAYNDFTLNATGISNISKTSVSKFGARNANKDVANVAPTWGAASSSSYLSAYFADRAGTTEDPKLVVTYTIPTVPIVTTQAVSNIGSAAATGNGNVTSDGGATITERGIVWSLTPTPTTSNHKATAAGTTGAYTANMTNLTLATLYYVRAYAINSIGTSYGSEVTFRTTSTGTQIPKTYVYKVSRGGNFLGNL